MGSYNYSCGLSHASIGEGDRVGVILIEPNEYSYQDRGCRIGATDTYYPTAPPIFGKYNDYGSIRDIEQSPAVNYIESKYEVPVEAILAAMQTPDPYWQEVSDWFCPDGVPLADKQYRVVDSDSLLELGFTKSGDNFLRDGWVLSIDAQNDRQYRLILSDDDIVKSKTFFASTAPEFFREYHKITHTWIGVPPHLGKAFTRLMRVSAMYYLPEVYEAILATDIFQKVHSRHYDQDVENLRAGIQEEGNRFLFMPDFAREVLPAVGSPEQYRHIANHPETWRPIFLMHDFMRSTNNTYMPPALGEQGGNPWVEQAVSQAILDRAKAQIKEIEEW